MAHFAKIRNAFDRHVRCVYDLLHSPDHRRAFASDMKKMLPRLPLLDSADDFRAFSKDSRNLADLHLNHKNRPAPEGVIVTSAERGDFRVTRIRFANRQDKGDRSAIACNEWITVTNIPDAVHNYVVNGRSAVEWVRERCQIRADRASGIVNDPNDWPTSTKSPGTSSTCSCTS